MLFNQQKRKTKMVESGKRLCGNREINREMAREQENLCNEMLYVHNFTRVFLSLVNGVLLCRSSFCLFHWFC